MSVLSISEASLDRFQIMRRDRIQGVRDRLNELGEIEENRFIAEMSIKYGIRPNTCRSYLRDLIVLGVIEILRGTIRYIQSN